MRLPASTRWVFAFGLSCALTASVLAQDAQPVTRITSYESLAETLTKAGVKYERDDANFRLKVSSKVAGQEAWAEVLWREDKGVCQVVQSLGFRVPPEHVSAVESAIARINHAMSFPGFYFNHAQSVPYCQHVVVLRPAEGGLPERVLQQVFRQLNRNVAQFRPPLKQVAAGTLKPEDLLAQLATPDSATGAMKLLKAFTAEGVDLPALSKQLRPQASDFAKVFKPDFAKKAAAVYLPAWDSGAIVIKPKPGQTRVRVSKATTEQLLAAAGGGDFPFPGGYKEVLQHMQPGVVWHRFKFTQPDEELGMAYDGLVQIDGRWVLFPKPYRVLEAQP